MYKIYKLKDETKRKILSDLSKIIKIKYLGSYNYDVLFEEIEDSANEVLEGDGFLNYRFSASEMESSIETHMSFHESEFDYKLEYDDEE